MLTKKDAKELAESDVAIMPEMEIAGAAAKAALAAAVHARKAVQRLASETIQKLRVDADGEQVAYAAALEREADNIDAALKRLIGAAEGIALYA